MIVAARCRVGAGGGSGSGAVSGFSWSLQNELGDLGLVPPGSPGASGLVMRKVVREAMRPFSSSGLVVAIRAHRRVSVESSWVSWGHIRYSIR